MVSWDAVSAIGGAAGSLVAAVSLVVAALTLRREGRQWRAERANEARERLEAQSALASLVSATTVRSTRDSAVVLVTNDGEQPVFHVRVQSARGAQLEARSDGGPIVDTIRRLESRQAVELQFRGLPGEGDFTRPVMEFVDVSGRRWRRAGLARPQRLTTPFDAADG